MKRFFKWLFNIQDEPQELLNDQWHSMRQRLLMYDLQTAQRDLANNKAALANCKPTDARRGVYQRQLQDAKTRMLKAENALIKLDKEKEPATWQEA